MVHRGFLSPAAAAFGLLLPIVSAASPADNAAGVLAKHKMYMGWSYGDGTLKSARSTIEAERPTPSPRPSVTPDPLGAANAKTIELRRELLYRSNSIAYGLTIDSEGFTGAVFWRSNVNGQTVTRRLRDARQALTEDIIAAEAYFEVPCTARPDAKFDEKNAVVVRVSPATGSPADAFFDRESGALLGYTVDPDTPSNRYSLHVLSHGEFAPGKRYVSSVRFGTSKTTHRVTSSRERLAG